MELQAQTGMGARTFHIVIPVHNRLPLTLACLASLQEQTYRSFRVYVVDDGSADGTAAAVEERFGRAMDLELLAGDGNLWWAGAIRDGTLAVLASAGLDDVLVTLNNDVTVPPGLLATALRLMEDHPGAMLGAVSVDSEDRCTVTQTGWHVRSWPLALTSRIWFPRSLDELRGEPPVVSVDLLPGTCTFIPLQLVRRFGTVAADTLPHYHADSEFSWRLRKAGAPVYLARDLRVYHRMGTTGRMGDPHRKARIGDLFRSFASPGSPNYLPYKLAFARAAVPGWARPSYLLADLAKSLAKGLAAVLLGDRARQVHERAGGRPA